MATLKEKYENEIISALMQELSLENRFEVPKLVKIVINVGLGDAAQNAKLLESAVTELTTIAGQKPVVTRAKKSIAGFKIRQGMPVGAMVTLRGERMYDFLAKLIGMVLPRIRDFRGVSEKGFDTRGNYNIGLRDQLVFPEIDYDKVDRMRGMNITLVTTACNDVHAKALLVQFGIPFRKTGSQQGAKPAAETLAS